MDKQKLIESGLLELYVLGELDPSEIQKIEHLIHDSEVMEEIAEIELNLEKIGFQNAENPPAFVKDNLMKSIQTPTQQVSRSEPKLNQSNVIPLQAQLQKWRRNFQMAAALAGLLALAFGWQLFSKNNTNSIEVQIAEMRGEIEKLSASNTVITDQLAYINHTYTTPIVLRGTQVSPNSKAVVYWNPKVDEALLSTNGLPELPDGYEYQIWADIDGEMVSMKVFDMDQNLITLPYMSKAESLNITVEPKGGSDHPTVEKLFVNATTES